MPRLNLLPGRLPRGVSDAVGRTVARAGITPNAVSLAGFAGNCAAAWLITREQLLAAGVVYLLFSALDLVDGAVARATNQATPFGAVFDAVLDRGGEAVVIAACAWYFGARGEQAQAAFAFAAILGSVGVSYVRALAEGEGLVLREGLFRRQERVALLGAGLLLDGLTAVIILLAILAQFTALQRTWLAARGLARRGIAVA